MSMVASDSRATLPAQMIAGAGGATVGGSLAASIVGLLRNPSASQRIDWARDFRGWQAAAAAGAVLGGAATVAMLNSRPNDADAADALATVGLSGGAVAAVAGAGALIGAVAYPVETRRTAVLRGALGFAGLSMPVAAAAGFRIHEMLQSE